MEIQGKIIHKLQPVGGVSKAGNQWVKQEYILETHDKYPRKVKFDFFNDNARTYDLQVGQNVTIHYDLESREFNGRWYTEVHAYKATITTDAAPIATPAPNSVVPQPLQDIMQQQEQDTDVPF